MFHDFPILRRSPLFRNMSDAELSQALTMLQAEEAAYGKGAFLQQAHAPMSRFGFVLSGMVQVFSDDIRGDRMFMAQVHPGGSFGESLHFLAVPESGVYIQASEDCRVFWMRMQALESLGPLSHQISLRFLALLTQRTLEMNQRIQILSKRTIREKLVAFFSLAPGGEDGSFAVNFDRSDMASYLGADRSALSRELARMRDEGLLRFERNRFQLLDASLLGEKTT